MENLTVVQPLLRKVGETALLRATLIGDIVSEHDWTASATGFNRSTPYLPPDRTYSQCGYRFMVAGKYTIACTIITGAGQVLKPEWAVTVR